jgi:hypothetical protein
MALSRKQRQLYEQASHILLDEHPAQDAHERVGLLTVITGVRPLAVFLGIDESDAKKLRGLLNACGFTSIIADGPKVAYTWQSTYPAEITRLFRQHHESPALWVGHRPEQLRGVKKGIDQVMVGALLGYPQCCIDAAQRTKELFEAAVIPAYIQSFGDDLEKISQALLEDRKVEVEWENDGRVRQTIASFPFIQHIACEDCLASAASATARLNAQYQRLVEEIDPTLHDYLLHLANRRDDDFE